MGRIAYVNGRYGLQRQACVNVEDRGLQFADGVYEVVALVAGRFLDVDRHLQRLDRSLAAIEIIPPMGHAALRHVLAETARRNRVHDGLVYLQVTRGVARRDFAFPAGAVAPTIVVTARRAPPYPRDPAIWAIGAITHADQRWARCDIKSTGMLAQVLAKQAARRAGAQEAIMIDVHGLVTEGASSTVWVVDEHGALRTRELSADILPGCTRDALLALLEGGLPGVEQRAVSEGELRRAREVFVTSATGFVKPVTAIDGVAVGPGSVGSVTRRMFDLFAQHAGAG